MEYVDGFVLPVPKKKIGEYKKIAKLASKVWRDHGALDYRVPDQQGLAYYNTLLVRGVPTRLVWFPDENHWVLKPRNSRLWYGEVLDWLEARAASAIRAVSSGVVANAVRCPILRPGRGSSLP